MDGGREGRRERREGGRERREGGNTVGTLRDSDDLSTKDTCFNMLILSVVFHLRDRDDLSTRGKIVGPKVSLVRRFH